MHALRTYVTCTCMHTSTSTLLQGVCRYDCVLHLCTLFRAQDKHKHDTHMHMFDTCTYNSYTYIYIYIHTHTYIRQRSMFNTYRHDTYTCIELPIQRASLKIHIKPFPFNTHPHIHTGQSPCFHTYPHTHTEQMSCFHTYHHTCTLYRCYGEQGAHVLTHVHTWI
jgi:hypothetical protein